MGAEVLRYRLESQEISKTVCGSSLGMRLCSGYLAAGPVPPYIFHMADSHDGARAINPATPSHRAVTLCGGSDSISTGDTELAPILLSSANNRGSMLKVEIMSLSAAYIPDICQTSSSSNKALHI